MFCKPSRTVKNLIPLSRNGRGLSKSSVGCDPNICSINPIFLNILLIQFSKSIQSRKNAFHIHQVSFALDAVAPMVFAKILFKKFVDMTGQKDVDRWIQEFLRGISVVFAPVFPIDLSETIIAGFLINAVLLETAFSLDERDDFQGIHSIFIGSMIN